MKNKPQDLRGEKAGVKEVGSKPAIPAKKKSRRSEKS